MKLVQKNQKPIEHISVLHISLYNTENTSVINLNSLKMRYHLYLDVFLYIKTFVSREGWSFIEFNDNNNKFWFS